MKKYYIKKQIKRKIVSLLPPLRVCILIFFKIVHLEKKMIYLNISVSNIPLYKFTLFYLFTKQLIAFSKKMTCALQLAIFIIALYQ